MTISKTVAVVALASAIVGCSFDVTDIQSIDIDHYAENEKNVKLAKDLIYYDPRYIAAKVSAFNESTSKGIRLGYFIRSSDGKPSYRITYSLSNPSVATNISALKKGFEDFIPKLAAFHASKETVFAELEPVGMNWAKSLFSESASSLLNESSTLLKEAVSPERFSKIIAQLSSEYDKPREISFVRAQYYEAFAGIPESVALFYSTKFADQKALMISINMHQQNKKWAVMGFRLEPLKPQQ